MPKGYIVARIDVTDPEVYARYTAETPRVAADHGGRFLVRGGRHEQMEGDGRSRHGTYRRARAAGAGQRLDIERRTAGRADGG